MSPRQQTEEKYSGFKKQSLLTGKGKTVKDKGLMLWDVLSGLWRDGGYSAARNDLYERRDFTEEEGEEKESELNRLTTHTNSCIHKHCKQSKRASAVPVDHPHPPLEFKYKSEKHPL